jgi:hypothetical protein
LRTASGQASRARVGGHLAGAALHHHGDDTDAGDEEDAEEELLWGKFHGTMLADVG